MGLAFRLIIQFWEHICIERNQNCQKKCNIHNNAGIQCFFLWQGAAREPRGQACQGSGSAFNPARFHWKLKPNWTAWWFGTCFIFPYIGNNNSNWRTHIFQTDSNHQPALLCCRSMLTSKGFGRGFVSVCWNWLRHRFSWSTMGAKLIFKSELAGGTLVVWARGSLAAWFVEPKSGTWW